ncbi:MAG: hypothetical protein QXF12_01555 [Candidatus Aenigmatarchaeota archaeon]
MNSENIRSILSEIIKYTGDLGIVNLIKVTDEGTVLKVDGMSDDKTVVVNGEINTQSFSEKIFGGSFGMTDFNLIKGLCNSPTFRTEESQIVVVKKRIENSEKESDVVPVEILFKDGKGQRASYRLMDASLLPKQAIFKGADWDVIFKPQQSKISEFFSFSNLYNKEKFFSVFTEKNNLMVAIGDNKGVSNSVVLTFVENVKGKIENQLYWPISEFTNIMKLSFDKNNDIDIYICQKGVMLVNIETPISVWKYIMPSYRR